jgi:hypothetical protein
MSEDESTGLTGVWDGQYSYPRGYEPTAFTAVLLEMGAAISGSIHEIGNSELTTGQTLTATLQGARAGAAIAFTKTYDPGQAMTHKVNYEGEVSGDGLQIEGVWRIPGVWSGRFIMLRNRPAREAAKAGRKQTVPAG